jgi:hypothetical protein
MKVMSSKQFDVSKIKIKDYKYAIFEFQISFSDTKIYFVFFFDFLGRFQTLLTKMKWPLPTCLRLTITDNNKGKEFISFMQTIQKGNDYKFLIKYEGLCIADKYNELGNDLQLFEGEQLYSYLYSTQRNNVKALGDIINTIKLDKKLYPSPAYLKELADKVNLEYLKLKRFKYYLYEGSVSKTAYEKDIKEYLGIAKVNWFNITFIYMKHIRNNEVIHHSEVVYCEQESIATSLDNLFTYLVESGVNKLCLNISFNRHKDMRRIKLCIDNKVVNNIINIFKECFYNKSSKSKWFGKLNCLNVSIDKHNFLSLYKNTNVVVLLFYVLGKRNINLKRNILNNLRKCLDLEYKNYQKE